MLCADFNKTRDLLEQQGRPKLLGAEVLGTQNNDATCHQGEGSIIDHIVVSKQLRGYVASVDVAHDMPGGPHSALIVKRCTNPRMVLLRTPRVDLQPTPQGPLQVSWDAAKKIAADALPTPQDLVKRFPKELWVQACRTGTEQEVQHITWKYAVWVSALEIATGVPRDQQGRALPWFYKMRPARKRSMRIEGSATAISHFSGPTIWLATTRAIIRKIKVAQEV